MKVELHRPIHAKTLTAIDEANMPVYLFVIDAINAGKNWKFIAQQFWKDDQPDDAKEIVSDFVKRAKWMTTVGYKHLLASCPVPRGEALDGLVNSGAMSPGERSFLDSPAGEKFWPRAKH